MKIGMILDQEFPVDVRVENEATLKTDRYINQIAGIILIELRSLKFIKP